MAKIRLGNKVYHLQGVIEGDGNISYFLPSSLLPRDQSKEKMLSVRPYVIPKKTDFPDTAMRGKSCLGILILENPVLFDEWEACQHPSDNSKYLVGCDSTSHSLQSRPVT